MEIAGPGGSSTEARRGLKDKANTSHSLYSFPREGLQWENVAHWKRCWVLPDLPPCPAPNVKSSKTTQLLSLSVVSEGPLPFLQTAILRWRWVLSIFMAPCHKTGQRAPLKCLRAKKREHILVSSQNRRTLGMGAMNSGSDSSSVWAASWVQGFPATWECKLLPWDCSAHNL